VDAIGSAFGPTVAAADIISPEPRLGFPCQAAGSRRAAGGACHGRAVLLATPPAWMPGFGLPA